MRYYMIFYRPEGSTTFTPCGSFHGLNANLFGKSYLAWQAMQSIKEVCPHDEFEVFVCRPVEWCVLSETTKGEGQGE